MTDEGRDRRHERLERAGLRRALMRGRREAHKRGLSVRRVGVNFCTGFGWEAWHTSNVRANIREFFNYGIDVRQC